MTWARTLSCRPEVTIFSSECLMPSVERPKQIFVRGQGSWLRDSDDRAYLDFSQGGGANSLGHSPSVLVNAITAQAQSLINPGFGLRIPRHAQPRRAALRHHRQ